MLSAKSASLSTSFLPQLSDLRGRRSHLVQLHSRRSSAAVCGRTVRAVISGDEKSTVSTMLQPASGGVPELSPAGAEESVEVRVVLTVRNKLKERLLEKVEDQWKYFVNGIGKGILVQLVSEEIDPDSKKGKRSTETAAVRGWLPKPSNHSSLVEYAANFTVPSSFGRPGAVIITNLHNQEFHLMDIVVHGFKDGPIFFPSYTWIHSRVDNPISRIIFSNQVRTRTDGLLY